MGGGLRGCLGGTGGREQRDSPSNIGLDGTIGGESDGKWYGGCYGWGFTVVVPQTGEVSNRNATYRGVAGFGNALLLTGERKYVDVWRRMLAAVNANSRTVDGKTMYPQMYGDDGWYAYQDSPYSQGALDVYYWSMDPEDLKYVPENAWLKFLDGKNEDLRRPPCAGNLPQSVKR